jgi:hypothetical protein
MYNRMLSGDAKPQDFRGKVLRRDPDGYGVVEFSSPSALDHKHGIFTREVFQDPKVAKGCKVGETVMGRVLENNGGFRIIRLEPVSAK